MIGYYYYLTKIRPYLTQSEKTDYTLLFLTLLTVLLFGAFGLRPLISSSVRAYSQLKDGERYETQLVEKIVAINQASANLSSAQDALGNLGGIMPEGPSQPQVIQELDQDAGAALVTLKSVVFHPQGEEGPERVGTHTFDFFATGADTQLLSFLNELEKGQLLEIQALQTNLRSEEGGRTMEIIGRARSFFIR